VPIDCVAPCGAFAPPDVLDEDAAAPPPAAFPPQPFDATQTGAFAVTGAAAAADGEAVVPEACAVPADWPADWLGAVPLEVAAVGVADAGAVAAWPPQPFEATQTGVFVVTGAETAAVGAAVVPATCPVPTA
jgi:hypothetical protein